MAAITRSVDLVGRWGLVVTLIVLGTPAAWVVLAGLILLAAIV